MSKVPVPAGVVSIHASAREATDKDQSNRKSERVSIHASAREATIKSLSLVWICKFQSTPPRGRRHKSQYPGVYNYQTFQSTPPRGRRLTGSDLFFSEHAVSIHASAREATRQRLTLISSYSVSIHASAREAT